MKKIILLLPLLLLFYSCPNDTSNNRLDPPERPAYGEPQIVEQGNSIWYFFNFSNDNEFALGLMKEMYLWNDYVSYSNIDANDYNNPQQVFDALKYEKDKWSYVEKSSTNDSYFQDSKAVGFGFRFIITGNQGEEEFRIISLQQDTDLYNGGARRGDNIVGINGYTVNDVMLSDANWNAVVALFEDETQKITFSIERDSGEKFTILAEQKEINLNSVDLRTVINRDNTSIGYISFNGFVQKGIVELNEAFTYFENQNINELIIDLRYNGGGMTTIAKHFVSILIGNKHEGKIFTNYKFNDLYSHWGGADKIENAGYDFNFDEIIFLTNEDTASASEMVMNALKPFTTIKVIGEPSNGKPVGMIPLSYNGSEYVFAPISFKYDNANGESDFYNGMPVDSYITDTYSHDYGDENDPLISEAIKYITTNQFTSSGSRSIIQSNKRDFIELEGLDRQKGFF